MADIFISYAREDIGTAQLLGDALEQHGLTVFWDRRIPAGKPQFTGLAETFNRSQYLLPPMERTALLQAIREPAPLYGGEVARPLAERLIADAADAQDTCSAILCRRSSGAASARRLSAAAPEPEPWPYLDLAAYERAGNLANLWPMLNEWKRGLSTANSLSLLAGTAKQSFGKPTTLGHIHWPNDCRSSWA